MGLTVAASREWSYPHRIRTGLAERASAGARKPWSSEILLPRRAKLHAV